MGKSSGWCSSCRVLGMGIEHTFMRRILDELKAISASVHGRIIPTSRNIPVRNLYRDSGFTEDQPGLWQIRFQSLK